MSRRKIPTTVLTGFLGAGKTTLLNKILTSYPGQKTAIIVNEFGDVGIDGQLVVGAEEEILELNNGCICCTVRGDLTRAVENLVARGIEIDRLVIETTGLADPAPVIQSFILDETLRSATELDAIVTVVDARHFTEQLRNEQAREQIAFADVIILNKVDLVSGRDADASVDTLVRRLTSLNPLARVHQATQCNVDLRHVLNVRAFDLRNALAIEPLLLEDSAHEHDADIQYASIRALGDVDEALFTRWLNALVQAQGKDLLRIKGIVALAGEPRRFVFHGVHMTLDGRPGKPWRSGEARTSELVFIGRNLDAADLRAGFEACRPSPVAAAA
jgi:G3E family GTPase